MLFSLTTGAFGEGTARMKDDVSPPRACGTEEKRGEGFTLRDVWCIYFGHALQYASRTLVSQGVGGFDQGVGGSE